MSFSRKHFLASLGLAALAWPARYSGLPSFTEKKLKIIKPKRLKPGDTLGIISPASPIYAKVDFEQAIRNVESLGFKVKPGKHLNAKYGYLAGTDEERLTDLHEAFLDDSVSGVLCLRGGWGSARLLPAVDYGLIATHPKAIIGFSDITALLLAIFSRTGLLTFHGPVAKSEWNAYTKHQFEAVLTQAKAHTISVADEKKMHARTIVSGKASGILLGGNLTVLSSLMGSAFLPEWKGAILFVEDVGEDMYKVDRMLNQLALNGVLDAISGFVFGECLSCKTPENSLSMAQILNGYLGKRNIPSFFGALISHDNYNATLPVGMKAEIDADRFTIDICEAAVL